MSWSYRYKQHCSKLSPERYNSSGSVFLIGLCYHSFHNFTPGDVMLHAIKVCIIVHMNRLAWTHQSLHCLTSCNITFDMFFFIILTTSNIDTITLISDKLVVGSPRSPFERDHTGLSDCPFWGINLALNSNYPWLCSEKIRAPHHSGRLLSKGTEGKAIDAKLKLTWMKHQVEEPQPHVSSVTFEDSPQQTEPWRHNTEHDKSWTQLNA